MRTDHRRPLMAYVLVALACSVVVAQGLRSAPAPFGPGPEVRTFADTRLTPSEFAGSVSDPFELNPVLDSEPVGAPVVDEPAVPGVAAVVAAVDELPWAPEAMADPSVASGAPGDDSQPPGTSSAGLVGNGGTSNGGSSSDPAPDPVVETEGGTDTGPGVGSPGTSSAQGGGTGNGPRDDAPSAAPAPDDGHDTAVATSDPQDQGPQQQGQKQQGQKQQGQKQQGQKQRGPERHDGHGRAKPKQGGPDQAHPAANGKHTPRSRAARR